MKRKRIILAFLAMMMAMASAWAQDELTVAQQTTGDSSYYVPMCGSYTDNGFWAEMIYPESLLEDMTGGTISGMTFYSIHTPSGSNNFDNDQWLNSTFRVYLSIIDQEHYTASTSGSWLGGNDMEQVFEGDLVLVNHELKVTFDEEYSYQGGNLCVRVVNTGGAAYHMCYFRCATTQNLASAYRVNTYSNPQSTYSSATNQLPQCTFEYLPSGGSICRRPTNLTISGVGPYGATLTFAGREEHTGWTMMYADHQFDPNDDDADATTETLNDESYDFSSLSSSTTYYVYLRGNCSDGESSWASTSFTTDILCYPVINVEVQATYTTAAVTWNYQDSHGLPHDEVTVTLTDPSDPDFVETITTSGTYAFFSGLELSHSYVVSIQNSCEGEPSSTATKQFATSGAVSGENPGNVASSFSPFYYSSTYSYSQTIFFASEIGSATVITGIEYNTEAGTDATYVLDVYAANTTLSTLSTPNDIPFSQFTQVAQGVQVTWQGPGWVSVPFTTPFTRDGSNLAIIVVAQKTSASGGGNWNGINTTNRVLYNNGSSPINPATVSTSTTTYMAGFRFLTTIDLEGCMAPNLLLADVDSNSMTAVWVAGNGENEFKVEYRAAGESEWTVAEASTSQTSLELTGLNANTLYEVRVSAICDDDELFALASARTTCATLSLPYTETFEGFDNNTQPSCWSVAQAYNATYPSIYNGATTAHGGTGYIYTYSNASTPNMVVSPLIPVEGNNIYCSFWARGVMPGSGLTVGVLLDPNDPTSFVPVTAQATSQTENNYVEFEFTTGSLDITDNVYVAFRWASNGNYGYLDDVFISEIPGCMRPNGVTVTNVMDNTATVHIAGNADATGYTMQIVSSNGTQTVALDAADTVYNISGLTPSTSYTIKVSSTCGGDASANSSDVSFTTQCGIVDVFPYMNNFDDASNFDCWSVVSPLNHTGTSIWHKYTGTASEHEYVSYPSGAGIYNSSPSDDWFISPGFAIPDNADNYVVQWYHFGQGTGSGSINYQVLISTSGTNLADFDTVFSELHAGQVFEFRSLSLADYAGDTIWIAFRNVANGGTGMIIDDFTVRDASAPMVSLTAPAIADYNTTVTLSATMLAGSSDQLSFVWSSTMQSAGHATLTATDSIATITYTTDGVDTVKVLVTNVFGTDSATAIINVRACDVITHSMLPYEEDFDSYTSGTDGNIDLCWSRISLYPSYPNYPVVNSGTRHGSTGNSLYFYPGYSYQPELAVLPQFDDLSDLYVHFWGYRTNSSVQMEVGVMTDPTDANSFELVEVCAPSATSTWQEFYVSLAPYTGTGHYIAFRGITTSSYGYSYYIDDISINSLTECATAFNNFRSTSATEESITVEWTPGFGLSDSFTLTLMSESGAVLQTVTDATSPYTFSGLNAETMYSVRVDMLCNGEVSATSTINAFTLCEDGVNVEVSAATTGFSAAGNYINPIDVYYRNSFTQTVYTAHELGNQAMNIVNIAWNYIYPSPLSSFAGSVYIRHISDSTISELAPVSDDDQLVFTGTFDFNSGWTTFDFDTPFQYDGQSNIVVTVMASSPSYSTNDNHFAGHTVWSGCARYWFSDSEAYSNSTGSSTTKRPDTRFGSCGASGDNPNPNPNPDTVQTCDAPTLDTPTATHNSVSISYSGASNYEVHIVQGAWAAPAAGTATNQSSYTFSNLQPETQYTVGVRAVCANNLKSDWTISVVTTAAEPGEDPGHEGIDDVDGMNISLQPNPATSMVTLKGLTPGAKVHVVDISGRTVATFTATDDESLTLDVSGMARGSYFVNITTATGSAVRKLVVQ